MTEKQIAEKYGVSIPYMLDRIEWAMQDTLYPDREPVLNLRLCIVEFGLTHGDEAIIALFGAVRYCQTGEKTEEQKMRFLSEIFRHDVIGGRRDAKMLPRSAGYTEFATA